LGGSDVERRRTITAGGTQGIEYPAGTGQPAFINPSPEPLRVSMEKQEKLKQDIQALVRLSLASLRPQYVSGDFLRERAEGLEAGLAVIGAELQRTEREIADIWGQYMSSEPATVVYPVRWSLQTDADRLAEITALEQLRDAIPSPTFQRAISVQIAEKWLFAAPDEVLVAITADIENAKAFTANPDILFQAATLGVLDLETVAILLGVPESEAAAMIQSAATEHAERAARVVNAQTAASDRPAARGTDELSARPGGGPGGEGEKEQREADAQADAQADSQASAGQR
jgi:hypothetical protein